jgi:hypothetical protein
MQLGGQVLLQGGSRDGGHTFVTWCSLRSAGRHQTRGMTRLHTHDASYWPCCIPAGDVFSQLFVEKCELNLQRTLTFTAMGLLFVGPIMFVWYGWLGKMIPGTGFGSILASLALDQLAFAPVFIAAFMSVLTTIGVGVLT